MRFPRGRCADHVEPAAGPTASRAAWSSAAAATWGQTPPAAFSYAL